MALEDVPAGQASDGYGLVLFVPKAGLAHPGEPTVAELTAPTVVPLTYSLTGDGYARTTTVNTITANRFTLRQTIEVDGTITDTLEVTYVYTNTEEDVARLTLKEGTEGYIVDRLAVANEVPIAAGQLVDVIPFKASVSRKNAPTTNSELTRTQKLNVTGDVKRDVAVVA